MSFAQSDISHIPDLFLYIQKEKYSLNLLPFSFCLQNFIYLWKYSHILIFIWEARKTQWIILTNESKKQSQGNVKFHGVTLQLKCYLYKRNPFVAFISFRKDQSLPCLNFVFIYILLIINLSRKHLIAYRLQQQWPHDGAPDKEIGENMFTSSLHTLHLRG